jgi:Protein of unknown function (DUF2959)
MVIYLASEQLRGEKFQIQQKVETKGQVLEKVSRFQIAQRQLSRGFGGSNLEGRNSLEAKKRISTFMGGMAALRSRPLDRIGGGGINRRMKFLRIPSGVTVLLLLLYGGLGCRSTYYAMWEKMGKPKRELLKDQVTEARNDQEQAAQQFKDALTRLREIYAVQGGELETTYDRLKADYDKCESRAEDVRKRIGKMDRIAQDLFKEWEEEIETYSSARLRSGSQARLDDTRAKYQSLLTAMRRAERSMDPVLVEFRDQVLYLKHNLNALAIGTLQGEAGEIEKEIAKLIQEMNKSIAEAEDFMSAL